MRETVWSAGRWKDVIFMGLLEREWRETQAAETLFDKPKERTN